MSMDNYVRGAYPRYSIPNDDICSYLKGYWKRNLEWRHFGTSYKLLKTTNTVIHIDEDDQALKPPNTTFLKWRMGETLRSEELESIYSIQFSASDIGMLLEWNFQGAACYGLFKPESSAIVMNFCLKESIVTITYRLQDENTMAICIVDVDADNTPTIQYGNMYRIDPSNYARDHEM